MNPKQLLPVAAVVCALLAPGTQASEKWLHVRVQEGGSRPEKVSVNVPLSVVERVLPLIESDELRHGVLHLDLGELEGIDLRELAAALRDAPDAEFVTVESGDESVRVRKERDFLVVNVEDRRGDERIRVRMPLAVVDALVGNDPGELDLVAALGSLADQDHGALIDVESDDSTVRLWIDSDADGE